VCGIIGQELINNNAFMESMTNNTKYTLTEPRTNNTTHILKELMTNNTTHGIVVYQFLQGMYGIIGH
jgi:hypothetical protein